MAEIISYALAALADESGGADAHAPALAALCDALAYGGHDVFQVFPIAYFSPRLPALLAAGEGDVPLFAARLIAESCEGMQHWAAQFARHGAIEALRDRLLSIEYMELAEECLRALNAISEECPEQCLRHGVPAAVLQFFDFFSTSKQKVALQIVTNTFTNYHEEDAPKVMEAAPVLCNLLQSTDKTILEPALSCLGMVASGASGNTEHMDRLCESNAVEAVMRLMKNDGWKSLSDETLYDILGLVKDLASASAKAVKSLFELGVCDLLKEMIFYYSCSHSNGDKLQTLVELIYHLLRPVETSDRIAGLVTAKKNVVIEKSTYTDQLNSIVTLIVQVAKSGAQSSICYSCILVIGNIVEISTPALLIKLQKTLNLSSFLSCLLTRKNRHIVFQTLKVSKALLEKHHQFFFDAFAREGVKSAIDAIQEHERNTNSFNHKQKINRSMQETCVCFDLDSGVSSTNQDCIIENNAIMNLAEEIKKGYFVVKGSSRSPQRFGCLLKSVRDFFARLHGHSTVRPTTDMDIGRQLSDISRRLLSDNLPNTSTFEFVESGSTRYLAGYLSNGAYFNGNLKNCQDLGAHLKEVQSRLQKFTHLALTVPNESSVKPLGILVEKLIDALHMCYDSFPIILSDNDHSTCESTMIPLRHSETEESTSLNVKFVRSNRERELHNYNDVLPIDLSSKPDAIEAVLWPEICASASKRSTREKEQSSSRKSVGLRNGNGHRSSRLILSYKGTKLKPSATIFESIVRLMNEGQSDILIDPSFWDGEHKITYKKRNKSKKISSWSSCNIQLTNMHENLEQSWLKAPFFCTVFLGKLSSDLDESDPPYNFLFMLKVLEGLNRFSYKLSMEEQIRKFAEGCLLYLGDLKVTISPIPQHQFMSSLLTNKLELQMQDRFFQDGLMPSWCVYLVETCPFLLSFDARWKYFCLTLHRSFMSDEESTPPDSISETMKYRVSRRNILESVASMMTKHGSSTKTIEVEFEGEVGTGRGPTFEFYTAVSHELQRFGLGMWRGDNSTKVEGETGSVRATFGLFPQPWSSAGHSSRGVKLCDVVEKFKLLGHLLARAVMDGRILDIPLSQAFYKIMVEQELDIYDIPSFDPELGKAVLEFQAIVKRKKFMETSLRRTSDPSSDLTYKGVTLEELCLEFTLPGNPEYELVPGGSEKKVTLNNLEEYVSLVVDATLKSGIRKQVEAFKSGIEEVFALKSLRIFTEQEMERILCGEQDAWASENLQDHMEFEHGYDVNSPSIINFLEILRELGREEQRAFIQFTTGAPQLPLGGLASLDPKLNVVRKQCDGNVDNELPSVNTCRHFIKLPPYSSKEIMRQKLRYALAEGLGSFHLS